MNPVLIVIGTAVWLYLLRLLRLAELRAWRMALGSAGMFVLLMLGLQPVLTQPLIRAVSALAGVVGTLTNTFATYFKFGIIYVPIPLGSITLQVDLECCGIIELSAFLSLLTFFDVYSRVEKVMVGIIGSALLVLFNAIRIVIICLSVHFLGLNAYYVTHMFVGRIFFYVCSVLLYFYVFTKPHVIQMKIGKFSYGTDKTDP